MMNIINQLRDEIQQQNQKIDQLTEKQNNTEFEFNNTQNTFDEKYKEINFNSTKFKSDVTNMLNKSKKMT